MVICIVCHEHFIEGDSLQAFLRSPEDPDGSWTQAVGVDGGFQERAEKNKGSIKRKHENCESDLKGKYDGCDSPLNHL